MVRSSSSLYDPEFGDIEIRRVKGSYVRLKIQTNGRLVAHLPRFVAVKEVERLLDKSRFNLRQNLHQIPTKKTYADGEQIGKSHRLRIKDGPREHIELRGLDINIYIKPTTAEATKNQLIKDGIAKALRKESKAYLPRRLKYLAMTHSFGYERVRFTHAKSRWGSCSTSGTISLNIMLMTLPNDLIDYVLLHELNHTKHMDHSREFWANLEKVCSHAKRKRTWLKQFSPYL
ncbi:M48 family metallopeptidase [Candidatus Saccharibacteria bacterium]|nr:M48 family metallopeptidase [Candidatus Saccharibacteria bacterium]